MNSTSFVAAQERLLARRRAREAALVSSASNSNSNSTSSPSRMSTLWTQLSSRTGTSPTFRVGQVDASLLDDELLTLLSSQLSDAVKYLGGPASRLKDDYAAEITLFLRAVLFKLSIWDHNATYGASLQNLQFADARQGDSLVPAPPTRGQKVLYGLLTVGGRYAWGKWERSLTSRSPESRLVSWTNRIFTVHAVAAFGSFLVFLLQGRYRTLLDRILGLRLVAPSGQLARDVSLEYLNRQLVWNAFTEFLVFLLPLVGIQRWRRWLTRFWRRAKTSLWSQRQDAAEGREEEKEKKGEFAFLPERTCPICYQDQNSAAASEAEMLMAGGGVVGDAKTDVTNPYQAGPCRCLYCFVCLATRLEREEGEGWPCLRCGELVTDCRPWSGDVLEVEERGEEGKHVGFEGEGEAEES